MSNTLLKLIKFGIGFILFIPLYVGGSFFFPFIFPKIWLFQLVIEIIFFLYVILAISDSRFRPKFNLITTALAVLTLVLIITSFTGIDIYRSFWGNTERMSGVIAWFHFVAFAVVLGGVLKSKKEWQPFFAMAAVVSILEFFYVIAQRFSASWVWLPGSQIGTIGNIDLLASYAIFSAFFALHLWQNNFSNSDLPAQRQDYKNLPKSVFKWLWAAAFFLNVGTLFLASSRGALLGFGFGLFVYVLVQAWQRPQIRKVLALAILVLFLLYGSLWLARDKDFVKNTSQLTRITNVSFKDDTVRQRFTEWGIAWDAFKARPFFGFGPNNYLYLHNAFLNPKVYELRETNFDRAHNAYLDYASMSGILGLAGYIFLIGALAFTFWKKDLWIWASLMTAYAVQSFFVFDSPASYIALFLTIGFAMYVRNTELETWNLELRNKVQPSSKLQAPSSQVVAVISIFYFLFTIYLIWQVSWKSAAANITFVNAFTNSGLAPEQAFANYKEAVKYETLGTTEFRNQFINWVQNNLGKFRPEQRLEVMDFGINQLEQEVKDHPLVFSYLNLGQLYNIKASGISNPDLKPDLYKKAAEAFDKALELAPKRLEVYYSYLQMTLNTKDYGRGVELLKRTTEFAPNYAKNWWYLGIANMLAGRNEDGRRYVNKALSIWYAPNITLENNGLDLKYDINKVLKDGSSAPPSTQEILGVVNPYIKEKRYKELLLLYLAAKIDNPNDVGIHQSLALVYQNLGLIDKALEELKISEQLKQPAK